MGLIVNMGILFFVTTNSSPAYALFAICKKFCLALDTEIWFMDPLYNLVQCCQYCVAGPGIAPGLEDYALLSQVTLSVGLYHHPARQGAWRVVSTDSPFQDCLGIVPHSFMRRGMSTDIAKFATDSYLSEGPYY